MFPEINSRLQKGHFYWSLSLQDHLITILVLRNAGLTRGTGEHNALGEIKTRVFIMIQLRNEPTCRQAPWMQREGLGKPHLHRRKNHICLCQMAEYILVWDLFYLQNGKQPLDLKYLCLIIMHF